MQPTFTLSQVIGPAGTTILASGVGYAHSAQIGIFLDRTTNLVVTATTDATGAFSGVAVTLPLTVTLARHTLYAATWRRGSCRPTARPPSRR